MSPPRQPAFRPLLSYDVNHTSDVLRRSAAMRFRREHDVSLMEWRTLARIEHLEPVTLHALVDYSSNDKAQLSRIVSALVERGLVERRAHATDARSAVLALSAAGRKLIKSLTQSAEARDRHFREVLSDDEVTQLVAALAKLRERAQELVAQEEALLAPPAKPKRAPRKSP